MKLISRNTLKSLTLCSVGTLCALTLVTNSYAAIGSSADVVQQLQLLRSEIGALATAQSKSASTEKYQKDPNLDNRATVNNANTNNREAVSQQAASETQQLIKNQLQLFPASALTYTYKTPDVKALLDDKQARSNLINTLTLDTPASDTLFTKKYSAEGMSFFTGGYSVAQPTTVHNNYFDYGTLISPTAYTPDQMVAAKRFMQYLTKSYINFTDGLDLDKLQTKLNAIKDPITLAKTLYNFMSSPIYQQFQLNVRSSLAARSVALNNLNQLASERTPILSKTPNAQLAALSTAIGVTPKKEKIADPNDPSKTIEVYAYASPLQISNYVANHRAQSKQWYQQVQSASPATVQREQLYVLAEMQSQLQQLHLDNERLLGTLSAMQLQGASSGRLALQTQVAGINKAIDAIGAKKKPQGHK